VRLCADCRLRHRDGDGHQPLAGFADADDVAVAWDAASVSRCKVVIGTLITVTLLQAPRGRRPGGHYFDQEFVRIDWSR
jgi:site-specific DNA recombinase